MMLYLHVFIMFYVGLYPELGQCRGQRSEAVSRRDARSKRLENEELLSNRSSF